MTPNWVNVPIEKKYRKLSIYIFFELTKTYILYKNIILTNEIKKREKNIYITFNCNDNNNF